MWRELRSDKIPYLYMDQIRDSHEAAERKTKIPIPYGKIETINGSRRISQSGSKSNQPANSYPSILKGGTNMFTFEAMNTFITTIGLPAQINHQVEFWFRQVEKKLSRFNPESELSLLNQAPSTPFEPTEILLEVLKAAEHYRRETGGLFNPYLGQILSHLGYSESFEKLPEYVQTSVSKYDANGEREDSSPIQLDAANRTIILSPNVAVDLGGIAKGWSAQQMCNQLKQNGVRSGVIDAGGDIVLWGEEDQTWEIGVADPFHPEQDLEVLNVKSGIGIATSSTLKRHWKDVGGTGFHHIIDPRTKSSGQSDLVQVTVMASDLTTAEVYAKCLVILGSEGAMEWLESRQPNLGVIGVGRDGRIVLEANLDLYSEKLN